MTAARHVAAALGFATLLVLLLLPAAPAQTSPVAVYELELSASPHDEPMVPNSPAVIPFALSVRCTTPPVPTTVPLSVELAAAADVLNISAVLEPATMTFAVPPEVCAAGGAVEGNGTLTVTTPPTLLEFTKFQVNITASAQGAEPVTMILEERVGTLLDTSAEPVNPRYKAAPNSRLLIPVDVRNAGNGLVHVVFSVGDNSSKALVVALPAITALEPFAHTTTVGIDVNTPFHNGGVDQKDTLVLVLHPQSASQPEITEEPITLSVEIHTVGTYVPAPGALWVVVAAAGIVAGLRRVRGPGAT